MRLFFGMRDASIGVPLVHPRHRSPAHRARLRSALRPGPRGLSGEFRLARRPARFGLGFQRTQPERPLGPNPRSFGHFGSGGALGFCDPDALAFGYVMNHMGLRWQNPRDHALIEVTYSAL